MGCERCQLILFRQFTDLLFVCLRRSAVSIAYRGLVDCPVILYCSVFLSEKKSDIISGTAALANRLRIRGTYL